MVETSPFFAQRPAVMLQGITLAGFNVVDLAALHDALGLPVLAVARRAPNLDAIRDALLTKVPGGARKWRLIEKAGPMEPLEGVFVQRAGVSRQDAAQLLRQSRLEGRKIPEPLRVAHLIAGSAGHRHEPRRHLRTAEPRAPSAGRSAALHFASNCPRTSGARLTRLFSDPSPVLGPTERDGGPEEPMTSPYARTQPSPRLVTKTLAASVLLTALVGCTDDATPANADGGDVLLVDGGAPDAARPDASGCVTPASATFTRPFDVDPADYPFRSCAFETASGTIHYVDDGPRDAAETILMVHGNPTWSCLYRNIARAMMEDGHRVVALDHLGSGMSDVPPTSSFDFRPRTHSALLEDLVVALDLSNVTLVVQDWGGPIGLGMATRQPDRIARVLIMNTWAWSVDREAPGPYHELISWYELASSLPPTGFCAFVLPGQSELNAAAADPSRGALFSRVLDAYLSPAVDPITGDYVTSEPCAPMQIFAESIGDDDAFQGEVEAGLSALRGKPYGLLFGLADQLFGALRCDPDAASICPGESTCVCDEELLPSRVDGGCSAPTAAEFHVCLEPDGSPIIPYPARFIELLGGDALLFDRVVRDADHMVQEYAPDDVVQALRDLLSAETIPGG